MNEAELQAEVIQLAESLGLVVLHLRAPAREGADWKGWPDLTIIAPGSPGLLFRELKLPGKPLRAAQRDWADILSGQDFGIWRPADWHSGRIRAELEQLAGSGDVEAATGGPLTAQERLWRALTAAAARSATLSR